MSISLCHIFGGTCEVLEYILDLPEGLERNQTLPSSEVYLSFLELKVFQNFERHLVVFV